MEYIAEELRPMARPVTELTEDPNNVRVHNDHSMRAVKASLERFGFRSPLCVKDGVVIAGNARLRAAKELGWDHVPVVDVSSDSDVEATLFAIQDNYSHDASSFDQEELSELLGSLQTEIELEEIQSLGWTDAELEELGLLDPLEEDSPGDRPEAPLADPPPDPITQPGDIIRLGGHTLRCGDSTEPYDWGVTAQLMVTDPPYGVRYANKDPETLKIRKFREGIKTVQNDDLTDLALQEFLYEVFDSVPLDPGASWYVFAPTGDQYIYFWTALQASNLNPKHQLVWVKNIMVLGKSDYQKQHESIIYGWKPGAGHYFIDDRTQTTVWEFPKPLRSDNHPTMKPIPLVEKAISNSSRRGDVVIDPFGGSGTTLLACENLGRICLTTELDPGYCDVIVDRWEKQTGRKAVRP